MANALTDVRVKVPRTQKEQLQRLAGQHTAGSLQAYLALILGAVSRGEIRVNVVVGQAGIESSR